MKELLKKRLLAVSTSGAIALAVALGAWYEGDGPTVPQPDGTVLYRVYLDPVGIPTVCRGVTGPDVVRGRLYTAAECRVLEQKHLARAEASARRLIAGYDQLNKWQKGALIDWLYNVGETKASSSTLRRKFAIGDVDGGCNELVKWIKGRINGELQVLPGLVDRRGATHELCVYWGRPGYPGGTT